MAKKPHKYTRKLQFDTKSYTNKEFVIGNIFDNPELLRKEGEE